MITWPPGFLEKSIAPYVARDVTVTLESAPAREAANMVDNPLGVVLVTDTQGSLKGVITKDDLTKLNQTPPPATAGALATTQPLVAIFDAAQVWQMLKIMNGENKARRVVNVLPVLDRSRRPVGVILRQTLRERMPQDLATSTP